MQEEEMVMDSDEQVDGSVQEMETSENSEQMETVETTEKTDPVAELSETVVTLEMENADLKAQLLRKQADFENYRKRMAREKQEAIKFANNGLCTDLVEVIDNFERAIRSSEDSKDFQNFHSGIVMIEQQFTSMLESNWGLKRVSPLGEVFDPQVHEALMMEDSPEYEESTVLEVFQSGYELNGRVLRPAKVKVSRPVAAEKSTEKNEQ